MSVQPGADITVGTIPFQIPAPGYPRAVTGLRLTNESGSNLPVNANGDFQNVAPQQVNVWRWLRGEFNGIVRVDTPQVIDTTSQHGTLLKIEWAIAEDDPFPGTYPQSLNRQQSTLTFPSPQSVFKGPNSGIGMNAIAIDPRAQGLLVVRLGAGGGTWTGLQVQGNQSSVNYINNNTLAFTNTGYIVVPLIPGLDSTLNIVPTPFDGSTVQIFELFTLEVFYITDILGDLIPSINVNSFGGVGFKLGRQGVPQSLPVVDATGSTHVIQQTKQSPKGFSVSIASGSATTLIAAVGGQNVFGWGWELFLEATAPGTDPEVTLFDGAITTWIGVLPAAIGKIGGLDFGGAPLTGVGNALTLKNFDSVAHTFDGTLVWDQHA